MEDNEIHLVIIGDEILSGKREDKHFKKALDVTKQNNYVIKSVSYLPDSEHQIQSKIENLKDKIVFCFGGIGATPDDHTRSSAAKAHQKALKRHTDAAKLIEDKFGKEAYPKRILMADLPDGSELIPNEINMIPGFYINKKFFMPGFPEMAWPMMEWVFKNKLPPSNKIEFDRSIIIPDIAESLLIDLMNQIENDFPLVKMYSLPKITPQRQVEFGIKGDKEQVLSAMEVVKKYVKELGYHF
ncbi:MAG: molybdopterin-binding protein [Methylophilaceae bacterium]